MIVNVSKILLKVIRVHQIKIYVCLSLVISVLKTTIGKPHFNCLNLLDM